MYKRIKKIDDFIILFTNLYSALKAKIGFYSSWGLIYICCVLTGCAYSPGITIDTSKLKTENSDQINSDRPSTDRSNTVGQMYGVDEALAKGVLLPITPELIHLQHAHQETELAENVKSLFAISKPYTIGSGDVLNIVLWDHPELLLVTAAAALTTDISSTPGVGNGYNVSVDGFVQFPYAGNVKLIGLTETQARKELILKLSEFIKNPQLTLRIQAYRSGRIFVEGEVKQPGVQPVNDLPLTVRAAIGRAGGFSAAADQSAVLVTREGRTIQINFPKLTKLGVNLDHILLMNGDTVQIPSRDDSQVSVLGEVVTPKNITLRNGQLTLSEALGQAGGVSQVSGEPSEIYVLRYKENGAIEIYHLDGSSPITYALAGGFNLKAKDIVFVNPSALVRFNRVISLLLPSTQTTSNAIGIRK